MPLHIDSNCSLWARLMRWLQKVADTNETSANKLHPLIWKSHFTWKYLWMPFNESYKRKAHAQYSTCNVMTENCKFSEDKQSYWTHIQCLYITSMTNEMWFLKKNLAASVHSQFYAIKKI
jgi:hypothetical protein